jgi:hypothetical protein
MKNQIHKNNVSGMNLFPQSHVDHQVLEKIRVNSMFKLNLKDSIMEKNYYVSLNKVNQMVNLSDIPTRLKRSLLLVFAFFVVGIGSIFSQSYTRTQTWASGGSGTWATFDWGASCKNLNTIVPSHALNINVQITMTGGDFDLYTRNGSSCPTTILYTSRPFLSGTNTETVSGLVNFCNSLSTMVGVRKAYSGAGSVTITVTWTVPSYTINSTTSLNETFNTGSSSAGNWLFQSNVTATAASPSLVASGTNVTTSPQEGNRMVFFDSYNIAAGGQSRLISPTLNTSGTGASGIDVEFWWRNDNVYTNNDGVQVQYSTDNGCTWINSGPFISRYNAGAGAGIWNLQSVSIGSVAVGANVRVAFLFTSQFGNNCFLDNVTIRQNCFTGNVATFGTNAWNVYCFSSGDAIGGDNAWNTSTIRGSYSIPSLSFDTRTGQTNSTAQSWGDASTPSNASGYSGCAIDVDYHSYIFKRQGFTCGTYQLNLPSHDDMAILLVDGVEVWRSVACCQTRTAVWTGYLGSSSTVELRVSEGGGGSHGALEFVSLPISATVTGTNPITCGGNGSIAISNVQNGHRTVFQSDFSSTPAGASVSGSASIANGELTLTTATNSVTGSAVLTPSYRANAWTANYSQFIGGGTGADGMSFTYGPISGAGGGEAGWGSSLVISFDTHNGATNSQLNVYWNGAIIWQSALNVQNFRTASYVPVKITVNTSNQLSVTWNSIDLLTNYGLPAGYGAANKSTWNYGFSARTGGANDIHRVSDIYLSSLAFLEYSINNGTSWSTTNPISAPAGSYTVQARPVAISCPNTNIGTVTLTNPNTIDWANLQFPASATICSTGSATVYGRVFKNNYTSVAGADANMTVQVGYSSSNTNPNMWAAGSWSNASYNVQSGNNDEYQATLSGLLAGTYYYAFRYRYCSDGAWYYGGYNASGGGFWNGTTNVSGILTVHQPSGAPTSISGTTTICNNSSTILTAVGGSLGTGAVYEWGTGSTVGTNPIAGQSGVSITVSPTSNTTYWVRIINSASPCATTTSGISTTVTVNQPSVAPTAITGTTTVCNGSSTTLTTNGTLGTGAVYEWGTGSTVGTNPIAGQSGVSISVSPSATTTYWVRIINGTAPCSATTAGVTNTVTVNQLSVAPSVLNASATIICTGSTTTLTQTGGSLGTGAVWQWYSDADFTTTVGGTLSTSNASISVSPTTNTTYYLRAINGTSPCVASIPASTPSTISVTISVNTPSVAGTASSDQTICSGETPTALNLIGNTGNIQWQSSTTSSTAGFSNISGASNSTLQVGALSITTYYRALVTSGVCASENSSPVTLTVNHPTTSISVSGVQINNGDYLWSGNTSSDGSLASNWFVKNPSGYAPASVAPTVSDKVYIVPFATATQCISTTISPNNPAVGSFSSSHVYIENGAELTLAAGSTFNVSGNFINNGTFNQIGNSIVNFTGNAATQTISGSGTLSFSNLTINKSVGNVSLGNNVSISGDLIFLNGNLNLNGKTLDYSGGYNITTNNGGISGSTVLSKLYFSTSSQITSDFIQDEIYDMTIGDNATVSSAGSYSIINSLIVANGATFIKEDGSTITFKGNLVNNGSIIDGTSGILGGSFMFNNTIDQTISGQPISITNMQVVKSLGKLVIVVPLTITGNLEMNGNIDNSASLITLGSSFDPGSLVYAGGTITGALRRYFDAAPTPGSGYYFPVGNSSNTRGATIDFASSPGSSQYLTVKYQGGASMGANPLYTGLPLTTGDGVLIQNYDEEGFWEINPTGDNYNASINNTPYTITLQMKNLSTVNDRSTVRIIKAAGSNNQSEHHSTWSSLTFGSNPVSGNSNSDFTVTGTSSGFSWFGAASGNNNPLPVELVSFSGLCEEGNITLTWQTASEFNSSHFDVEKSRDGENWQMLATVPSAGTSNELLTYQTVDQNATDGNNYFRLRQVDIDGTEKVYDPINVSCAEVTPGYFSSFPNPSGTSFQLIVNNKELIGTCVLNMVDATGKVIEQREIEVKDGINMFVINQELTPGIYFMNISNGSKSTSVLRHAVK